MRKQRIDTIDITGKKFGDLTAIRLIQHKVHRGALWECICNCGNICNAPGGHLRAGKRKSCGCKSESRIYETGINRVFALYKRKALLRKKEFSISRELFKQLISSNCFYCGREPGNELKRLKTKKTQIKYNGIDRFDPLKGYTSENCVSCCYYCNHGKADLSFEDWKKHLLQITSNLGISNGI